MEIDIIGLISACSYALDCIEAELVNIKNKHGKRVAYISVRMGQYFDLPEDALQDLAICALLHDNALTQYISEELQEHSAADLTADLVANTTNLHCIYGEQNLAKIPFKTDVTNAILYHHEHADGTGPFHKKWDEVPLSARIIHLADVVDIIGHSGAFETQRWDMVKQYRNHTSIILWGVRINESQDDDAFYRRTNEAAHEFDDSRPTGGVRANRKSSLLEDVYTYNDFVHDGKAKGCEPKKNVTSDMEKPYLISEYNGHMYPTKTFDWEEHRAEHALRHANVLDAVAAEEDIAGCFGWCMFDYNTHKDFGSGDRICYHGVMDMFRNPKLAAAVYACQQEKEPVLELSSSMDIGEHPGCNRGETYIFTNADKVRMYKNDRFIKEYSAADSPYTHLKHGPILIDDFIGDALQEEHMKPGQEAGVKKALNAFTRFGFAKLPKSIYATGIWLILRYHMNMEEAVRLYNQYIGDWGGTSTTYRFEAVMVDVSTRQERVVKTIIKEPMTERKISAVADHENLIDAESYDVAEVRIQAQDEHGNILPFYNEPLTIETEGPIEIIGAKTVALQGGMGGIYVKSQRLLTAEKQDAVLIIRDGDSDIKIGFTVRSERNK